MAFEFANAKGAGNQMKATLRPRLCLGRNYREALPRGTSGGAELLAARRGGASRKYGPRQSLGPRILIIVIVVLALLLFLLLRLIVIVVIIIVVAKKGLADHLFDLVELADAEKPVVGGAGRGAGPAAAMVGGG